MNLAQDLMGAGLPLLQAQTIAQQDGAPVTISGNVTINVTNAGTYDGKTLVLSTAATITLAVGIPSALSFAVRPPASGNASIASDGTVLLNGATTTLTRDQATNILFAVVGIASNSYAVTGL